MSVCWQNAIKTFDQKRRWYGVQSKGGRFGAFYYSMLLCDCNWMMECGSLGSKFDDLENYISSLTSQFDVIALSETWLKADTNLALYQLNDYYMYQLDRVSRKGGGVAIYVKNTLKHRLLNQMTYVNDLLENEKNENV